MPLFTKQVMSSVAAFATAGLVFATAGPAGAQEQLSTSQDPTAEIEHILMEGVDPSVATMSEDQLVAAAEASPDPTLENPARDLIVQRMTEATSGDAVSDPLPLLDGAPGLSAPDRYKPAEAVDTEALEAALSELVAPAGNMDDVKAVVADQEISAAMQENGINTENMPQVDAESGAVRLSHPSKEGHTLSIAAKGATKVSEHQGVVESKNEETGTLSVAQITDDMGGQVVSLLNSPETPYADFEATLPPGYVLAPEADGTVSIRDTLGKVEGKIDNAWAVDANGKKLDTHYEVLGDGTLRQHVDTTDAAFPIAADPSWWWWVTTSAKCAVEIGLLLTPLKIAKVITRLRTLVKGAKVVQRAVRALGGIKNAAIAVLKTAANNLKSRLGKWGRALPRFRLTRNQINKASDILKYVGLGIWELLGFGGCFSLIKNIGK